MIKIEKEQKVNDQVVWSCDHFSYDMAKKLVYHTYISVIVIALLTGRSSSNKFTSPRKKKKQKKIYTKVYKLWTKRNKKKPKAILSKTAISIYCLWSRMDSCFIKSKRSFTLVIRLILL